MLSMIRLLSLILFIHAVGWFVWAAILFLPFGEEKTISKPFDRYCKDSFLILLTGFGSISILSLILAHLGVLRPLYFFGVLIAGVFYHVYKSYQDRQKPFRFLRVPKPFLLFFIFAGILSIASNVILKPKYSLLLGSDGSVYMATANHLATTGNLKYDDSLVSEMTQHEREVLFQNRFPGDTTGIFARFPGGVKLPDPSSSIVTFHFYHLFPIWLAIAIKALGTFDFIHVLSIFSAISLMSLYFIGKVFGGRILGVTIPVAIFFFFPQLYYASHPYSENLSQALFLSGLWVFLIANLEKSSRLLNVYQSIAALLWGAMFLCRMDGMMLVSITLLVLFCIAPALYKDLPRWKSFFFILVFSISMALLHQISSGIYIKEISDALIIKKSLIKQLCTSVMENAGLANLAFLFVFALFFFLLFKKKYSPRVTTWVRSFSRPVFFFTAVALFVPLLLNFRWKAFRETVGWCNIYIPLWLIIFLLSGVLIACDYFGRKSKSTSFFIVLVFFIISSLCYMFNPMVSFQQPWAIRRFIPIVIPLFFVLSLSGWYCIFNLLRERIGCFALIPFVLVGSLTVVVFYGMSSFMLDKDFSSTLPFQMNRFSQQIPENSIVIIPDSSAGLHLQIALQYSTQHPTMLLPFRKSPGPEFVNVARAFFERQLAKGKTILFLTQAANQNMDFWLSNFNFGFCFDQAISFEYISQVGSCKFPSEIENFDTRFMAFRSNKIKGISSPRSIDIGQPKSDIPFIRQGFYAPENSTAGPENSFRWTDGDAVLDIPVDATIPLQSLSLSLRYTGPGGTNLRILFDGLEFYKGHLPPGRWNRQFFLEERVWKNPMQICIQSDTFIPADINKASNDTRKLGVAVGLVQIR